MDKSPEQAETELEDDYFDDVENDPETLKLLEFYRTHPDIFAERRRRFVDEDTDVFIRKGDSSSK